MMRLPHFRFHAPRTVQEAADLLASASPGDAMIVAGGTDLLPNMKRRQQVPSTLIGLRGIAELRAISNGNASATLRVAPSPSRGDGLTIGASVTLSALVGDERVRRAYTGLWQAASQVATPLLRNMGTIGGNLCLDTRCNY
ncbi:MAG: 4-hydroxybenzoyl-CoA reductase, partial [Acidobacteria bacterium]